MGWFFGSGHKYESLPTDDSLLPTTHSNREVFSFDSIFEFKTLSNGRNFKSIFNFDKRRADALEADYYKYVNGKPENQPFSLLDILSFLLTSISYLVFFLGFPISYWFCVHKISESDRLVVFRLGRMTGVKGPGRVVTFPWIDTYKRVNVSAAAFSVPPQQFITNDGGIVEMGAEVQYGVVDIVTMVKEVADHQDILRSLSKSLLTKVLTKKSIQQLLKDRRIAAQQILSLLNEQVRKWGIDVRELTLSDPKVMRKPENKSSLGPILQNLGLKQEQQFPSPQQFVKTEFGMEPGEDVDPNAEALNTLASAVGGFFTGQGPSINLSNMPGVAGMSAMSSCNASQSMPMGSVGGYFEPQVLKPREKNTGPFWLNYLQQIIGQDGLSLESEAMGLYQIIITETESGKDESYMIDISPGCNRVKKTRDLFGQKPMVQVTISSSDLLAVLQGSLSPLQAYLTGRISASGDVKKLMFFDKISSRGHKQGSMFNI